MAVTKKHYPKYEQSIESVETEIRAKFAKVTAENDAEFYERMLHATGAKIVFYMHGNSGSRAASHRVELYKVLREQGYHVIAFDYRGYGDSLPNTPTETGLVNDAITVYKYITGVTKNPVIAWGHSLGTGVGCHTLAELKKLNIFGPRALVLESPFNNIRDEVREHPFSRFFRHLPWFDYTIVDPMFDSNLRFESDKHIATFPQPVMILHAEDDIVVPFKLGHQVNKHWIYLIENSSNYVFIMAITFDSRFSCIYRRWKSDKNLGALWNFIDLELIAVMDINSYAEHQNCLIYSIHSLKRMEMKAISY